MDSTPTEADRLLARFFVDQRLYMQQKAQEVAYRTMASPLPCPYKRPR